MARVTTRLFIDSEDVSIEELSNAIGVSCDTSRRKGIPLPGRPEVMARTNSWRLEAGSESSEDPDEVNEQINVSLRTVIGRIEGHEEAFKAAHRLGDLGLLIGVRADNVPPIVLEAAIVGAIAALQVDLQIDLIIG